MSTMSGRVGFFRSAMNFIRKQRLMKDAIKEHYIGEDHFGNKYFMRRGNKEVNIRESRRVVPPAMPIDPKVPVLPENVPHEWEAWLRGRRSEPPSIEELEQTELEQLKVQARVRELEMKESQEMGKEPVKLESSETGLTKDIEGDTSKQPFPKYDDFEKYPGELASKHMNRKR